MGDRQGFLLRYQPIVRAGDGKSVGAEALLYWQDLLWGQVGPSRFLPWLENDPCFFELGFWILRRAVSSSTGISCPRPWRFCGRRASRPGTSAWS